MGCCHDTILNAKVEARQGPHGNESIWTTTFFISPKRNRRFKGSFALATHPSRSGCVSISMIHRTLKLPGSMASRTVCAGHGGIQALSLRFCADTSFQRGAGLQNFDARRKSDRIIASKLLLGYLAPIGHPWPWNTEAADPFSWTFV